MPINVSYTNARGETAVLDHDIWNIKWLWNIYGSEGLEAPELDYKDITYADGTVDTLTINMKPRKVTLYFVVWTRNLDERRHFEAMKQQLIQTGTKNNSWGQLKIRREDGRDVVLNCVYVGGLDEFIRKYPKINKFALTFHAEDPLFYDAETTAYVIQADAEDGYLLMEDLTFPNDEYDFELDNADDNPDGIYMEDLDDPEHDDADHNPNSVYMKSAENESEDVITIEGQKIYPIITISGSARNIRITNATTGKKIEFASDVVVDGSNSIRIDTRKLHRKVVQVNETTGAETNLMPKLTADSDLDFPLERGDNVVYFRNSEATPESKCSFEYTEGYLSAL